MTDHELVAREAWLEARKALLAEEKALTRERDRLSAARRDLPWVRIEKSYVFDGPDGDESLGDLFEGRSQLIVYHFMYDPEWEEGCKSCSFWADGFERLIVHLNHRDVSMVAVSKAPLATLEAYKARLGWTFKWVSSFANDFNRDFNVSFTPEELEAGEVDYNYGRQRFPATEAPGISVFAKDDAGIYHTYSCYSRGLDMLNPGYHYLDLVPKGRDEDGLSFTMEWLRRRDEYA
jgi:predicted dithiol-disulfide oxidoreductase (DUF899 family)